MTEPKRILVTGDRLWRDWSTLHNALVDAYWRFDRDPNIVVVDGGDRTNMDQDIGADFVANNTWGSWLRWPVESYPAEKDPNTGRLLYRERNAKMIALGADLCLGFMPREVRVPLGVNISDAVDCVQQAQDAGIPVIIYEENPFNVG